MRPRAMRQSSPGRPKVWSPCACVTKILSTSAGRTMQRCSWTCVPSPVSKSQKESFTCVGNGAAQASPAGSPEGRFQRQTMLQAIPSFGQPRPISRLGRAGRLYRLVFLQGRARAARGQRHCGRAMGCTRHCQGSSSRRRLRCCRARSFGPPAGRSTRRPAAAAKKGHWVRPASLAAPPQVLQHPLDAERSDQLGLRPLPPRARREQCRLLRAVAQAQAAHRPTQAAPAVRHVAPGAKPPRALVPGQPWCQ